ALPSVVAHGRPQAEAVALAHHEAPRAAQGRHGGLQLLPDVPHPPPAAPRLQGLWPLRRARDRARARSRPRSRL
ncbi:MAG: hypothetical protein AVDCRST_MAG53-995, partial [uncultured Solirubrobacteraceae bacterium]